MDRRETPAFARETTHLADRPNLTWIKHGLWLAAIGFTGVAIFSLSHGRPLIKQQYPLSAAAIALLSLFLLRRWPRLAAWFVLITVWWELTLTVLIGGSFNDAALFVFPLLVTGAGLLVGSRGAIIMAAVSLGGVITAGFCGGMTLARLQENGGREGFWLFVASVCVGGSAVMIRAALRSYSQVLNDSERDRRRYRGLFEQVPLGLIGLDPHGVVQEVNDEATRLLGLARAELAGRPIMAFRERIGLGTGFDLARARERQEMVELSVDQGQGKLTLELTVRAVQMPESPTLLMLRDTTHRKLIELHLGHAQRLEAVGQLAGGIAHDFNNLQTAIGGGAQMILLDGDSESKKSAQMILAAQARGSNLTRQLLAFARRDVHQPGAIDLAGTVTGLSQLADRLLGKQHELVLDCGAPVWINADAAQIEQVVLNLVTNACDAMPRGGKVRLSVRSLDGAGARAVGSHLPAEAQALLEVADTGTGIPEELRVRIFEPFFTTKARGKGTGLGLAAVQGIVAQNQGQVVLESTLEVGSTFRLFFPASVAADNVENGSSAPLPPAGSPSSGRILVVDDESAVRETTAKLLRHAGFEVLAAGTGDEALAALTEAGPVELVLTDLAMPGMDGRELAERIRAQYPATRLLYMSGYFNDPGVSPWNASIAAAFLAKPFSREQLLEAVRAARTG